MSRFFLCRWRRSAVLLAAAVLIVGTIYTRRQPSPGFVAPPFETGTISVVVTDENEERISGATIIPHGLRSVQDPSTGYGWVDELHGIREFVKTNDLGLAEVMHPKWVSCETGTLTSALILAAEHPDYCLQTQIELPVPEKSSVKPLHRIKLKKGGRLRVKALREGSDEPSTNLRALISGQYYESRWKPDGAAMLSPVCSPQTHVVRLVDITDPDAFQFSDPIEFNAIAGKIEDLEVRLHRGMTIRGQLEIPTLVSNGRVIASVVDVVDTPEPTYDQYVGWQTWTTTNEKGEFEIRSLPPTSSIRIHAWCDGFVCRPPTPESIPSISSASQPNDLPQFFEQKSQDDFLRVAMEPCARCEITVKSTNGHPVQGIEVALFPNIQVGVRSSTLFGYGRCWEKHILTDYSSFAEVLEQRPKDKAKFSWAGDGDLCNDFVTTTDDRGRAAINDLPGRGSIFVHLNHDKWVVKSQDRPPFRSDVYANLKPGETAKVDVVVKPKPVLTPEMLVSPNAQRSKTVLEKFVDTVRSLIGL